MLARTGVHIDDMKVMAKGGPFMKELRNTDEAGAGFNTTNLVL